MNLSYAKSSNVVFFFNFLLLFLSTCPFIKSNVSGGLFESKTKISGSSIITPAWDSFPPLDNFYLGIFFLYFSDFSNSSAVGSFNL